MILCIKYRKCAQASPCGCYPFFFFFVFSDMFFVQKRCCVSQKKGGKLANNIATRKMVDCFFPPIKYRGFQVTNVRCKPRNGCRTAWSCTKVHCSERALYFRSNVFCAFIRMAGIVQWVSRRCLHRSASTTVFLLVLCPCLFRSVEAVWLLRGLLGPGHGWCLFLFWNFLKFLL